LIIKEFEVYNMREKVENHSGRKGNKSNREREAKNVLLFWV
jgi:hypothetical protein